jgi:hypothetical protein
MRTMVALIALPGAKLNRGPKHFGEEPLQLVTRPGPA